METKPTDPTIWERGKPWRRTQRVLAWMGSVTLVVASIATWAHHTLAQNEGLSASSKLLAAVLVFAGLVVAGSAVMAVYIFFVRVQQQEQERKGLAAIPSDTAAAITAQFAVESARLERQLREAAERERADLQDTIDKTSAAIGDLIKLIQNPPKPKALPKPDAKAPPSTGSGS